MRTCSGPAGTSGKGRLDLHPAMLGRRKRQAIDDRRLASRTRRGLRETPTLTLVCTRAATSNTLRRERGILFLCLHEEREIGIGPLPQLEKLFVESHGRRPCLPRQSARAQVEERRRNAEIDAELECTAPATMQRGSSHSELGRCLPDVMNTGHCCAAGTVAPSPSVR